MPSTGPRTPEGAEASSLGHVPADRWEFDQSVADVFDDMLRRSIPQYDVMRQAVHEVACRHVQPRSDVVDLGAARGEQLAPLVDKFGAHNRFVAVECSHPMAEALRHRFKGMVDCKVVDVREEDLRLGYPPVKASVTLAVLTLQFVPVEHRHRVLRDAYRSTLPGGALVVVEKVLGATSDLDALFVDLHHRSKVEAGYTRDEVDRKRLSLEGVLVPLTAEWNEMALRRAGFHQVECFWRWMNFAAWVAIKS